MSSHDPTLTDPEPTQAEVDEISTLIRQLETTDLHQQREVSQQLIARGASAAMPLCHALREGSPSIRKSAAYLLGRLKETDESIEVLCHVLLHDEEPKVRQNAAVSLGKLEAQHGVGALIEALNQETIAWIRSSIILALGAIGGEEAKKALQSLQPDDEKERESLRKALDHSTHQRQKVEWKAAGADRLQILLEAPVGLEEIALEEAQERGFAAINHGENGLLKVPQGENPVELLSRLRCIYGILIDLGDAPLPTEAEPAQIGVTLTGLILESEPLQTWREWLQTEEDTVRFRFSWGRSPLRREDRRNLLHQVRIACRPLQWIDSPSNYDVELIFRASSNRLHLYLRPSFMEDARFAYRLKDVGASIHPVVGACLARLARSKGEGTVFDPTCGSGTLLIERVLLDDGIRGRGLDVSPTAISAARTNVAEAGLNARIKIRRGDALKPEYWPDCDEVIANLPFGMRTRRSNEDLSRLYEFLISNLTLKLKPQGRAVLYSHQQRLMEAALKPHLKQLKVEKKYKVWSGDLWNPIWVLRRVK